MYPITKEELKMYKGSIKEYRTRRDLAIWKRIQKFMTLWSIVLVAGNLPAFFSIYA